MKIIKYWLSVWLKEEEKNVVLYVVNIHKIGGCSSTSNKNSGINPLSAHTSAETFLLWDPRKAFFPYLYESVPNSGNAIIPLSFHSTHLSFLGTKHSLSEPKTKLKKIYHLSL